MTTDYVLHRKKWMCCAQFVRKQAIEKASTYSDRDVFQKASLCPGRD
jgi:hypothetical protein